MAFTDVSDPLAHLPADLRAVIAEFWRSMAPTGEMGACPVCGVGGLEVREAVAHRRRWRYVLHCDDARLLGAGIVE